MVSLMNCEAFTTMKTAALATAASARDSKHQSNRRLTELAVHSEILMWSQISHKFVCWWFNLHANVWYRSEKAWAFDPNGIAQPLDWCMYSPTILPRCVMPSRSQAHAISLYYHMAPLSLFTNRRYGVLPQHTAHTPDIILCLNERILLNVDTFNPLHILRLPNFSRPYDEMPYHFVKRGPHTQVS